MKKTIKITESQFNRLKERLIEDCWDGYQQKGMKDKDGKKVPNCVPTNNESTEVDEVAIRKPEEEKDRPNLHVYQQDPNAEKYISDNINESKKDKVIDEKKLKELSKSIKFICDGEYGDIYYNENEISIWVCLGDSNPFDSNYLDYFIKGIVAINYDSQDKIHVIIENEAIPDNSYKKI